MFIYGKEFLNKVIDCLRYRSSSATIVGNKWTFAVNYGQFQKVAKELYVYVLIQGERVLVQAYYRGDTGMCCLESRFDIQDTLKAFELGDMWLDTYGSDTSNITRDAYSPFNPNNKIPYHI